MGGDYYDRDYNEISQSVQVNASSSNQSSFFQNNSTQYSALAKKVFSQNVNLNPGLNPTRWKQEELICESKNPIVFCLDITGSMGDWPMIIWDKMPMFYGQIKMKNYLQDPSISFCAIGDATCDEIPLQVSEFGQGAEIDQLISKMVLFRSGGGNDHESYELGAHFYLNNYKMENPEYPFFFITGDEGYWDSYTSSIVTKFIGTPSTSEVKYDSYQLWQKLKEKFNVFLIKKKYGKKEVIQWNNALGEERVLDITNPKAVVDIILGAISITTGTRTFDEYVEDMKERGQDDARISEVTKALYKYNEMLENGEITVIHGSAQPKAKPKQQSVAFDFSSMNEVIEKLLVNSLGNDKLDFYSAVRKLRRDHPDKIPKEMLCPITGEMFIDPVSTIDGNTFEKAAIEYWFHKSDKSPITGKKLPQQTLIPNFIMKKLVTEFVETHKDLIY